MLYPIELRGRIRPRSETAARTRDAPGAPALARIRGTTRPPRARDPRASRSLARAEAASSPPSPACHRLPCFVLQDHLLRDGREGSAREPGDSSRPPRARLKRRRAGSASRSPARLRRRVAAASVVPFRTHGPRVEASERDAWECDAWERDRVASHGPARQEIARRPSRVARGVALELVVRGLHGMRLGVRRARVSGAAFVLRAREDRSARSCCQGRDANFLGWVAEALRLGAACRTVRARRESAETFARSSRAVVARGRRSC